MAISGEDIQPAASDLRDGSSNPDYYLVYTVRKPDRTAGDIDSGPYTGNRLAKRHLVYGLKGGSALGR